MNRLNWRLLTLIFVIYVFTWPVYATGDENNPSEKWSETEWNKHIIATGLGVPLNGSLFLMYGRPISDRVVLSNHFTYFNRDWMVLLEEGDWTSRTGYYGLVLQYYPFAAPGQYRGYYIGGDTGLAVSKQTYKPLSKSDIFFFGFLDGYFLGYTFPITRGFHLDCMLGGGWAPVSNEVVIEGHTNEGDFYPLANFMLAYRW